MIHSLKNLVTNGQATFLKFSISVSVLFASSTQANTNGIPTPVGTVDDGNYIKWAKDRVQELFEFIAQFSSVIAFFAVGIAILMTFNEVQKGKKEWRDLFIVAGVGIAILIVVFFMFNEGVGVLGAS